MGEIRFDAARMAELSNRIDDIANQLKTSNNAASDAINSIEANINGSEVKKGLTTYKEACDATSNQIYALLLAVNQGLKTKVSKYTQTEQDAANILTDVQSILQGIE